jgi:proline iminopeptidase
MKKLLRILVIIITSFTGLILITFAVLYFSASGDYKVADTVAEDSSIPHIKLGDRTFHAETFGADTNETVIILHGGPGNDYRYLLPLKPLSDQYHLVFYDQRGTGLSPRVPAEEQTLENTMKDLHDIIMYYSPDKPVSIIGHSWGAMMATAYIGEHPEKVRKVVMAEPGMLTTEQASRFNEAFQLEPSWDLFTSLISIWFESMHVEGDEHAQMDYFMGRLMLVDSDDNPLKGYYCEGKEVSMPYWRMGFTASQEIIADATNEEGAIEIDLVSGLKKYNNKVLFFTGECNKIIGTEFQQEHLKYFNNVEHVEVADAGHTMLTEKPEECIEIIRKYFAEEVPLDIPENDK